MAVAEPDGEKAKVAEATKAKADSTQPTAEGPVSAEPPPRRWLYADKHLVPGDKDALGFGAYADALALLMDWKDTSTPLTIAINGPWGSGKTSLAKMTEARLAIGSDWDAPHVICWFDAWANDDAPHLGAAFAAAVAKGVNMRRRWWVRFAMPLPSVMLSPEQRWYRRLWFGVLALALAAFTVFWPTGGSLLAPLLHPGATVSDMAHGTAATRLAWPLLAVAVVALAQKLLPSVQGVARWIDNPRSEAARGSMQDANRQLRHLIAQALRGKRRLIIFVDNLERCRPPRAVEVCEVVSQLIGHPEVVTVLIGDMDTIALSAEIKYSALESVAPGATGTHESHGTPGAAGVRPAGAYGRAYLEKLIQIQLRLPPPLPENLRKMLVPVADERSAFPPTASERELGSSRGETSDADGFWGCLGCLVLLGAFAGAIGLGTLLTKPPLRLPSWVSTIIIALIAGAITVFWTLAGERRRQRKKKRNRITLDKAVGNEIAATETALRDDSVKKLAHEASQFDERVIRRRMRQRIISNNELRNELDHAVLKVLPLSPRAAKRMFNHAHLLLDIGVERGIFATQPGLRADQLAAWVALTERWPSVGAAIISDPRLMGRLEEATRNTDPDLQPEQFSTIEKATGITGLDPSLLDHLRRSDSLVPCVRMLVNFSPDTDGESEPNTQASATDTDGSAKP